MATMKIAKKTPPAKKIAKKTPAKKTTAKKTAAKKTATKKTATKKAATKKAATKKAATKKAATKTTATKTTASKKTATKKASSLKRAVQKMPAEIAALLEERELRAAYEARPAYQRNDWLAWIGRAVREATTRKRIDSMLKELAAGHGYMGMKWSPSA